MFKNQLDYDNAQEPETTLEEALEQKQACLTDKIEKEIKSDVDIASVAFINHLSAELLNDEDYELLRAIVGSTLYGKWENRHDPINTLINNAIRSQAWALAKREYPGQQNDNV
jgi:hypothetical protein